MKKVMVNISNVDWALLRRQKEWLVSQLGDNAGGLLCLLDSIMDQAADILGEDVVFDFQRG